MSSLPPILRPIRSAFEPRIGSHSHQVFLSATRRANTMESDSKQFGSVLARADGALDVTALGDPFLLGEEFAASRQALATSMFGEDFSKRIAAMETALAGTDFFWLRQHFVFIGERISGGAPLLDVSDRPSAERGPMRSALRRNASSMPASGTYESSWRRLQQRRHQPKSVDELASAFYYAALVALLAQPRSRMNYAVRVILRCARSAPAPIISFQDSRAGGRLAARDLRQPSRRHSRVAPPRASFSEGHMSSAAAFGGMEG